MFFTKVHEINSNDTVKFLRAFPLEEFWRFFVERSRYDYRESLYRFVYKQLMRIDEDELRKTPIETILEHELFKELTLESYEDALWEISRGSSSVFDFLNLDSEGQEEKMLKDFLDMHQGWVGFECKEPGYLLGMAKGLCFLLDGIRQNSQFNVDFVKKLHETCLKGVKNTRKMTKPGKFRESENVAAWDLIPERGNSFEGLLENIVYLKSIQGKYPTDMNLMFAGDPSLTELSSPKENSSEIEIWVQKEKGKGTYESYSSFKNSDPGELAKEIWAAAKEGMHVQYVTSENGGGLLDRIHEDCIQQLEDSLKKATSKQEKLVSIFTFLKHLVLFHPFDDGVGRTYSMLLMQYLLMRENLMPVMFEDSNMIPGLSVEQLVNEYARAEKEMLLVLNDPNYIKSSKFSKPNVDTESLLKSQDSEHQAMFQGCLSLLKIAFHELELSAATNSLPNKISETPTTTKRV
ncbi:TPA: hypothetical protein ACIZCU_003205 [Legionella pneumophila]|nr:hypothetical protein [Legionella pneumophila]HAT8857944.1 hypothetical protein [Legionella pneumophila subsp. pneumophila]HAT8643096.1 hypothetical protein [Legionella pneumophila]HAT8868079.1 hypothetical protein [Legionella pneumophila subsp. pneumophila]HAT8889828.1 hypothetical protein [Legionella pneumophila subsp. pneumophila]HAT8933349.1 hypothetical protein [Legionella pneumophila subsp. pneumophila]